MLGVLDNSYYLLGGPVKVQHVEHDGQVVAHEVAEPDRQGDRGKQDEQGDDGDQGGVGEARGSGHPVIVQERFPGHDHDLYKSGGPLGDIVE